MAGSSSSSCSLLLLLLLLLVATIHAVSSLPSTANASGVSSRHPLTAGFRRVQLSHSQFVVEKPYNVPLPHRYEQRGGFRRMWLFANDKPVSYTQSGGGGARTEIKVNKVYRTGVWQFEGDMYVPSGTSGVSVMHIFGAAAHHATTTLMLHVYNGRLIYYDYRYRTNKVLANHVYNRWIRLNVIHDVAAGTATVFINGKRRLVAPCRGGKEHYFKFGVYKQSRPSYRMESRWKNVAIYTKQPYA